MTFEAAIMQIISAVVIFYSDLIAVIMSDTS